MVHCEGENSLVLIVFELRILVFTKIGRPINSGFTLPISLLHSALLTSIGKITSLRDLMYNNKRIIKIKRNGNMTATTTFH